jgi:hypothetical protein
MVAEQRAAECGEQAAGLGRVLDRDGQAVKRAKRLASHHLLLTGARRLTRTVEVARHHGVDRMVDGFDPAHATVRQLDRRKPLQPDEATRLDGREIARLHRVFPLSPKSEPSEGGPDRSRCAAQASTVISSLK